MAFTIEDTPKDIDFAKNQIGFKLSRVRSLNWRFYFIFTITPPVGSYIEFAWDDKLVRFDVVAAADNSGTQLTSTDDTAVIHADLIKNTVFNNAWERADNGVGSHLAYVEKDPLAYVSVEITCSENAFRLYYVEGKYEEPQRLVSELFTKFAGDKSFASNGFSFHPLDYSNFAYINISDKLVRGFKPYVPTVGWIAITEIKNVEYYLKIWEYLQSSANMFQELQTTDTLKALNGKLPVKDYINFDWPTPFSILTNTPDWRETWNDTHQELTLLITDDILTFTKSVKMYFTDETDATEEIETVNCSQYQTFFISAGFTQLDIATLTPDGKTCYRYEVVITSGASSVSKSFVVTDKPEFGRVIRFMNSKGGYDVFIANAYVASKKSVDSNVAEKSINIFNTETELLLADISNPVESFEMQLDGLTRSEVEHLKEILESPFVYLQEDLIFKRIVLSTKELELWDDKADLFNPKIEFRYA